MRMIYEQVWKREFANMLFGGTWAHQWDCWIARFYGRRDAWRNLTLPDDGLLNRNT
jgi:hypothetical protein